MIQPHCLALKEVGSVPDGGWSICFVHTRRALPIHVPMVLPAAPPTSSHFGVLFALSTYSELHLLGGNVFSHLDCFFVL